MEIHIKGERKAGGLSYVFWTGVAVFTGVFVLSFSVQIIKTSYRMAIYEAEQIPHEAQAAHASFAGGIVELGRPAEDAAARNAENAEMPEENAKAAAADATGEITEERKSITITLVGDIMLDRNVESSVRKNGEGDFSFIFENLDFLKKSDVLFGNLEGPVSDKGEDLLNLYSFRMEPEVIPRLRDAGFDVLSVANNHTWDWGEDAFYDTLDRLLEHNILPAGGGRSRKEAEEAAVIEREGMRIGFLAFSDIGPKLFEAESGVSGILYADDPRFENIIRTAKSSSDILVVSIHFGVEYQFEPTQRQRDIARRAVDAGADIIAGHHAHVIQGVERYNDGIIAYGLGNFIFDQNFSEETMKGLVLDVLVEDARIAGYKKKKIILNDFFQPIMEF
jgi:poly-gamma-glutamate capsule biosynthesis protein CapA/YwtB (metallophosphatase superfamily)